ncbi:MAG: signal peptidase II [Proteobacteria bacterium]|nr:signal peptidase II [Pseudomonadota bacterium]MBS0572030.1 signal peptidase II [Pseudomonadota bacterium]
MRTLVRTALATFAADQITKLLVVHGLNLEQALVYPVWPPWLEFRMAWNDGINFGLLSSSHEFARWLLIALALGISGWIWLWAARERKNPRVQIFSGLLIGGAMGNVVDRLIYGAVADFLNMSVPGINNPFSFNVADVAIFLGALGLVIFSGRDKTPVTRRKS